MKSLRVLATALLLGLLPLSGHAHGPTLCVGMIKYGDGETISLDLRFGVGLLHKYVDPSDDAHISQEEWTSSTATLRQLFGSGIRLAWQDTTTTPSELTLNLTSGSEIQVLVTLEAPTTATAVSLALPVLRRFPAAPPAQVSLWYHETMIRAPELLWFDKEMPIDRTRRTP